VTLPNDIDAEAFRRFEHDGWDRLCKGYHNHWEHLTTQIIPAMLEAAMVSRGTALLDVACGPGYVSDLASRQGAKATGVDLSGEMVKLARGQYPALDFQCADAEDLPYQDSSFDVVAINFGVLHFPDTDRALSEAHRVLKPAGRLVFTAWSGPENSAIGFALDAISKCGTLEVDLPSGPPVFRFGSHEECKRTVHEIGFEECDCTDHLLHWTLPAPDALMDSFREATARTSGLLGAQKPDAIPAIKAAMAAHCAPFMEKGKTVVPMPAVLTVATKAA
jgi:SAM-dependent methyltransferase